MSLLERLERRYDEIGGVLHLIHLDVNYRCHPMLTKFLADVVYKYPIKSADNYSKKEHLFDVAVCPCFFYCCHINSDVPSDRHAMETEAKAVVSLLEEHEFQTEVPKFDDNVCIVSSVRKQVSIVILIID